MNCKTCADDHRVCRLCWMSHSVLEARSIATGMEIGHCHNSTHNPNGLVGPMLAGKMEHIVIDCPDCCGGMSMAVARAMTTGLDAFGIKTVGYAPIPKSVLHSLVLYVEECIPPGRFLRAMLENDLLETVGCADNDSYASMASLLGFIANNIPGVCWGSKDAVKSWLDEQSGKRTYHTLVDDRLTVGNRSW